MTEYLICDPSYRNRPVVGKGHLRDNNERSREKIMNRKLCKILKVTITQLKKPKYANKRGTK